MTTLADRLAEAIEVGHHEDMPHEPIILDDADWSRSHALVQYNLNRCVANIHDERERINGILMRQAEQREHDITQLRSQREADLHEIGDRLTTLGDRLTSLETRVVIYAAVAGSLGGCFLSAIVMVFFRKLM